MRRRNIFLYKRKNSICRHFYISKKQLYRLFKKNFNTTVKKYIFGKKIEHAKRLLSSTDQSVSRIAEETGFADYNNFIQQFRKKKQVSHRFNTGTKIKNHKNISQSKTVLRPKSRSTVFKYQKVFFKLFSPQQISLFIYPLGTISSISESG